MIRAFRRSVEGLRNLWFYLPVIWNDRQWDYGGLYWLMSKKLARMEQFWDSSEPSVADQKEVAKQVRLARLLCERLSGTIDPKYNWPDDYEIDLENYKPMPGYPGWATRSEHRHHTGPEQTVRLLARELERHSLGWWD